MRVAIVILFIILTSINDVWAQCAMCRASLENNVSNGNPGIALGINFGIMYLFVTPYIAIGVIAFLWFRTSKENARK
ncbi:MAG: hypothetical protein JJE09_10220 [Bacteroidia bacterium]|nr:hypothetical protein [Bacteroidia bacterium]